MKNYTLYDSEDDSIDRGDSSNFSEAMDYYNLNEIEVVDKEEETLNQKLESDYHNTYYKGKGVYGTRTLRMSNKAWHKLNG